MAKTPPPTVTKPEFEDLPWFDSNRHVIASGGIFEIGTGVQLGGDGQPVSLAARMMRADAAAAAAPAAAAEPQE